MGISTEISVVGVNIEKCNMFKLLIQVDTGLSYLTDLNLFVIENYATLECWIHYEKNVKGHTIYV